MDINFTSVANKTDHQNWLDQQNERINSRIPAFILNNLNDFEASWLIECWTVDLETRIEKNLERISDEIRAEINRSIARYERESLT